MNKPKSLWLAIVGIVACIGCCSIPLYTLFAGATGLAMLWSDATAEVLKCVLPLMVFGIGYLLYRKRQARKRCCPSPQSECNDQKCASEPSSER